MMYATLNSLSNMGYVFSYTEVLGIQVSIVLYVVGIICICRKKK